MSIQEKHFLELYKKSKEAELGWGDSSEWTSQDFERLSEMIFQKTQVRLSESTLKRVWGKVKYDSVPAATTLNTLAQFSGYESWRSFKAANEASVLKSNEVHKDQPYNGVLVKKKKLNLILALSITGLVLLIPALLIVNLDSSEQLPRIDSSQVEFDFRMASNELPNSVIFNYSVGKNPVDTLKLQQSWDPSRQEIISTLNKQHTSIYYYPGFFVAKLIADNIILKEQNVFIKTEGWKGIIVQNPIPTYLSDQEIELQQNSMAINRDVLATKTGKTVFNNLWTGFYRVEDFGNISSDNFKLEAVLQNTSTKEEAVCQQAKVTILTTQSAIVIPLSSKGCISAISIYTGEKLISGKDTDLSALGCDFSQPQKLTCTMVNRNMTLALNDQDVFTTMHSTDLGKIVGLVITFEGTGRASNVRLY